MSAVGVDIALLPVSGLPYVMTTDEAVQAAGVIKTRLAIPMHVGRIVGALSDADYFKANATVLSRSCLWRNEPSGGTRRAWIFHRRKGDQDQKLARKGRTR